MSYRVSISRDFHQQKKILLQGKLNRKSNAERRSWEHGPPFCYCFWQLQLLRALPLDPGTKIIACASCSFEPETTHVNHSVQNFFSEGSSEKIVEPRGRRCWRTWCSLHGSPRRRRPRQGWSRGRKGYWSCWDRFPPSRMQMARPSTAPSMPSRSAKEERESSTASAGAWATWATEAAVAPRRIWEWERREMRLRVLAGPCGPPLSSAGLAGELT